MSASSSNKIPDASATGESASAATAPKDETIASTGNEGNVDDSAMGSAEKVTADDQESPTSSSSSGPTEVPELPEISETAPTSANDDESKQSRPTVDLNNDAPLSPELIVSSNDDSDAADKYKAKQLEKTSYYLRKSSATTGPGSAAASSVNSTFLEQSPGNAPPALPPELINDNAVKKTYKENAPNIGKRHADSLSPSPPLTDNATATDASTANNQNNLAPFAATQTNSNNISSNPSPGNNDNDVENNIESPFMAEATVVIEPILAEATLVPQQQPNDAANGLRQGANANEYHENQQPRWKKRSILYVSLVLVLSVALTVVIMLLVNNGNDNSTVESGSSNGSGGDGIADSGGGGAIDTSEEDKTGTDGAIAGDMNNTVSPTASPITSTFPPTLNPTASPTNDIPCIPSMTFSKTLLDVNCDDCHPYVAIYDDVAAITDDSFIYFLKESGDTLILDQQIYIGYLYDMVVSITELVVDERATAVSTTDGGGSNSGGSSSSASATVTGGGSAAATASGNSSGGNGAAATASGSAASSASGGGSATSAASSSASSGNGFFGDFENSNSVDDFFGRLDDLEGFGDGTGMDSSFTEDAGNASSNATVSQSTVVKIAALGTLYEFNDNGFETGSVYLFERTDANNNGNNNGNNSDNGNAKWKQTARIVPNDLVDFALFGWQAELDGDIMVVAAPGDVNGSAFVYRRTMTITANSAHSNGNSFKPEWIREAKLVPVGDEYNGNLTFFGGYLDIRDNIIAISDYEYGENEEGAVFIYEYISSGPTPSHWALQDMIQNNDCDHGFGTSFVLLDAGILIGCPGDNGSTGSIFYYLRSDSNNGGKVTVEGGKGATPSKYTFHQKMIASGTSPGDVLAGWGQLSSDGSVMVVRTRNVSNGTAHVFTKSKEEYWSEMTKVDGLTGDDTYGTVLAMDRRRVIVSSRENADLYLLEEC